MIRFGVLGAGSIAHTFSSAAVGVQENLYAIASRDLSRAEAFQKQYGYEKAYGSYEELLADSLVDCVYVATPHGLHFEQMLACIEHGKHILCEKAFTLNAKEAKIVFDRANEKKLFVMEAMWSRFLPTIQEIQKAIQSDEIGEIFEIEITFGFAAGAKAKERLFAPELGGGALLDIGIYPITFANLFLGIPDSVESVVTMTESGVDLESNITYFYPEAQAVLRSSFKDNLGNEAYIYGSKGYIHIPNFHAAEVATIFNNNHKVVRIIEHKHLVNGFEYEIFEAVKCIRKKHTESSIMPHSQTLEILSQMDEIRKEWNLVYPSELK